MQVGQRVRFEREVVREFEGKTLRIVPGETGKVVYVWARPGSVPEIWVKLDHPPPEADSWNDHMYWIGMREYCEFSLDVKAVDYTPHPAKECRCSSRQLWAFGHHKGCAWSNREH